MKKVQNFIYRAVRRCCSVWKKSKKNSPLFGGEFFFYKAMSFLDFFSHWNGRLRFSFGLDRFQRVLVWIKNGFSFQD
jgi:hypothetical protein